jgi:hypothetical protein
MNEGKIRKYRELLSNIRSLFDAYGEFDWASTISRWIDELDAAVANNSHVEIEKNMARTKKSLGGMGSIGDVVISPEAGHKIASDMTTTDNANERLLALVHQLWDELLPIKSKI